MSKKLILASSSPRRRSLLSSLGFEFGVIPAEVNEIPSSHESPKDFALRVAERKALVIGEKYPQNWIIGADTVVAIGGEILGKPRGKDEAKRMLERLADKEHLVITGYCLLKLADGKRIEGAEETRVKIKSLEEREMDWYINTGEPFDKAGGYAIQGKGAFMVEWIQGSYTNVVGLPLCQLIELLKDLEVIDIF
ncbi:MAG: septum formation protein Maf [Deltaproteobacteria bacterium]|nr:septum formation protein Maf [Deltaproteobacteria bacterium]